MHLAHYWVSVRALGCGPIEMKLGPSDTSPSSCQAPRSHTEMRCFFYSVEMLFSLTKWLLLSVSKGTHFWGKVLYVFFFIDTHQRLSYMWLIYRL